MKDDLRFSVSGSSPLIQSQTKLGLQAQSRMRLCFKYVEFHQFSADLLVSNVYITAGLKSKVLHVSTPVILIDTVHKCI